MQKLRYKHSKKSKFGVINILNSHRKGIYKVEEHVFSISAFKNCFGNETNGIFIIFGHHLHIFISQDE